MRTFIALLSLILAFAAQTAAGAGAEYKYRLIKTADEPGASPTQAREICVAKAKLAAFEAGDSAASNSRALRDHEPRRVCESVVGVNGRLRTECHDQSEHWAVEVLGQAIDQNSAATARRKVGSATLHQCLAEYGYKLQRKCARNCN